MSLTSILDYNNKDFKDFRELLSELFSAPKLMLQEEMKSPPGTRNYMLVGKAFDYLLRFHLEKKYGVCVFGRQWVAESALKYFNDKDNRTVYSNDADFDELGDTELLKLFEEKIESNKRRNEKVKKKFNECRIIYKEFISSKQKDETSLIKASLFLGRLDDVFRRGPRMKEYINFEEEDVLDVNDLSQLILNCDLEIFRPKEKIILNPTFGEGSKLVKADGDLIIDHTLIDIKVTKELKLTRPIYNQLIGYYLLFLIGGVDSHKEINIKKLGIYFARHNVLWTVTVDEIGRKEKFNTAIMFLKKKLEKRR